MNKVKIKADRFGVERKKSSKLKLILIFLTPILLSSLYIWQRVTIITLSAQTKELRSEIKQHERTLNYMQIEVAKLSSIDRIENIGEETGFARPHLDSIGFIQESPDSTYLDTLGLKENVWAKLKTLKLNLLFGDQAEAKEIKHDR